MLTRKHEADGDDREDSYQGSQSSEVGPRFKDDVTGDCSEDYKNNNKSRPPETINFSESIATTTLLNSQFFVRLIEAMSDWSDHPIQYEISTIRFDDLKVK